MREIERRLGYLEKSTAKKLEAMRSRLIDRLQATLTQEEKNRVIEFLANPSSEPEYVPIEQTILDWTIEQKLFSAYELVYGTLPSAPCKDVADIEEWAELPAPDPGMSYSERCKRIVARLKELAEEEGEFEKPA